MEQFANEGRMLPEQVFGASPPPGKAMGEGTGSATPLAWSHAEYIKLLRSKKEKRIVDTPAAVQQWAQCVTTFKSPLRHRLGQLHRDSWRQSATVVEQGQDRALDAG